MKYRFSIRQRLLILLLSLVTLLWLGAVLASFLQTRQELNHLFDEELLQWARTLLRSPGALVLPPFPDRDNPQRTDLQRPYRLQSLGKGILASSHGAAILPPWHPGTPLLQNVRMNGEEWRLATVTDGRRIAQVAENLDARQDVTGEIAQQLLAPLWLVLPLLALVIGFAVRQGLAPLRDLTARLEERQPQALQPIAGPVPAELQPLLDALNGLFRRVDAAFAREQEFTAHAAHELRTPLAGLRIHAQLALRHAESGTEREALQGVVQGVDRATHVVEQLLALARLGAAQSQRDEPIDVPSLLQRLRAAFAATTAAKGIHLTVQGPSPAILAGRKTWLEIALRNLVDNAIRYSPPGSIVHIRWEAEGGRVSRITICDNGPGVPADALLRIFQPFYRDPNRMEEEGSGLGLAIVQRATEALGGRAEAAAAAGGGLCVHLIFSPLFSGEGRGEKASTYE
ncbi:MAG: ATP-binding protein [Acidithiobacillus sp.]|uniref:ATP-binding protein n=1 Tax=Acidithiobacillus sp. TaxID=1872118 RepID=UPI003D053B5B